MKYNLFKKVKRMKEERGFTLLLAALVSSIVLSIGAAIFSIALKQVALASTGKNSQFAFYAADTGAECALFQDVRNQAFATSSGSHVLGIVACDETQNIATTPVSANSTAATTTFEYTFISRDAAGSILHSNCVDVQVAKSQDSVTNGIVTTIHADGYSTDCTSKATDPQALQRSVELHY